MNSFRSAVIALFMASWLQGCASSSEKIAAQYVSPVQYQAFTCSQLAEEARRISSRVAQLSGAQDQKASNDALLTAAAVVVFWPAAFFVGGDGATAAELGRLKGELEAVDRASVQKNCGLQIQQREAPPARVPREPRA